MSDAANEKSEAQPQTAVASSDWLEGQHCECGGYYGHSSKCPRYETPEHQHEKWKAAQKDKWPNYGTVNMEKRSGIYRIRERDEIPNLETDFQIATRQWLTPRKPSNGGSEPSFPAKKI
jgi:hypothetical protein